MDSIPCDSRRGLSRHCLEQLLSLTLKNVLILLGNPGKYYKINSHLVFCCKVCFESGILLFAQYKLFPFPLQRMEMLGQSFLTNISSLVFHLDYSSFSKYWEKFAQKADESSKYIKILFHNKNNKHKTTNSKISLL